MGITSAISFSFELVLCSTGLCITSTDRQLSQQAGQRDVTAATQCPSCQALLARVTCAPLSLQPGTAQGAHQQGKWPFHGL